MKEILEAVGALAREVGQWQMEQRSTFKSDRVETKQSHDYVSYVDKESEQMIVSGLQKILPGSAFLTEEKTTEQGGAEAEWLWVVDPLDGTTNFIHDLGPWCVSIALNHRGELVLGVVYEAVRQELYYAARGSGAWLQAGGEAPKRIMASKVRDLDQALIMVGYPYNADGYRDFCMRLCSQLYGHCASLRSMGSAEAELCYVAAGRIDVYFESFLQPWDVSAGAVILQEAGGQVSDYAGTEALWPSGRQLLATNGMLHRAMLAEIAKANR